MDLTDHFEENWHSLQQISTQCSTDISYIQQGIQTEEQNLKAQLNSKIGKMSTIAQIIQSKGANSKNIVPDTITQNNQKGLQIYKQCVQIITILKKLYYVQISENKINYEQFTKLLKKVFYLDKQAQMYQRIFSNNIQYQHSSQFDKYLQQIFEINDMPISVQGTINAFTNQKQNIKKHSDHMKTKYQIQKSQSKFNYPSQIKQTKSASNQSCKIKQPQNKLSKLQFIQKKMEENE